MALRDDHADRRAIAPRGAGVHDVERPDAERDEIARERPRRREGEPPAAVRVGRLRRDRRVRHGDRALRDVERELPGRLERGLVEARERAARVDRFELGVGVPVAAVLLVKDALRVLGRDAARVFEAQEPGTRRKISLKGQTDVIAAPLGRSAGDRRTPSRGAGRHRLHVEFLRVQPDGAHLLLRGNLDLDPPPADDLSPGRSTAPPRSARARRRRAGAGPGAAGRPRGRT